MWNFSTQFAKYLGRHHLICPVYQKEDKAALPIVQVVDWVEQFNFYIVCEEWPHVMHQLGWDLDTPQDSWQE